MTLLNTKKYYSRFLAGHEGKLHFAAHSHHFWPDVTREAQIEYWDDSARSSDEKWEKIFGTIIPIAQNHIAHILNLKNPEQIAFAPNTHELFSRLLSCFLGRPKLTVLTTSHEFHSARRQLLRLMEEKNVQVKSVEGDILNERRQFIESLKTELQNAPDLFFISQVFFDSGLAITDSELYELFEAKNSHTIMVIDGYHGFAALPTDLSKLEGKVFYLAGGYKYAQAGEGAAFMVIPKGNWRPANTGWFAEYSKLSTPNGTLVGYSQNYMSFMGATQDPSGLYRFNSVWKLFKTEKISIKDIHSHIKTLQTYFIDNLPVHFLQTWDLKPLFNSELSHHGHFLTFEAQSAEMAEICQKGLKNKGILIDRRGNRLRFGFGLYHGQDDISKLLLGLNFFSDK